MFQTMNNTMRFRFITVGIIILAALVTVQLYQTQLSLAASNIVLYSDNVIHSGNLGGRAGADAICQGIAGKPMGFNGYRALISVSATDEIQDMPTNYGVPTNLPIVGSSGPTIANTWADLLIGPIQNSLNTATGVTGTYWTGSRSDGSLATNNCTGWSTTAGSGEAGSSSFTDGSWLDFGTNACNTNLPLVCMAYMAPTTAVGGVAQTIAMPTPSANGLGYLAGLVGVVMLAGAGWLVSKR